MKLGTVAAVGVAGGGVARPVIVDEQTVEDPTAMGLTSAAGIDGPTADEIVARAHALIPTLRERAAHTEQLRRIPAETIAELRAADILRMAQSPKFGGLGYGVDLVAEVAMEIGRGCGSTAWMAGQWPGHQFMVGYFPLEAQEEYFDRPDTMSSTASAVAKLSIEPERGGWRIRDSQMRFSSGCDVADWIFFTTFHGMCLIPKSQFQVLDDWYVAGLRGTGSKSVVVEDAWVPPHRFIPMEALRDGTAPGTEVTPDNAYLRSPFGLTLNTMLVSPMIGMARGVLDLFEERVTRRVDLHSGKPASESPGNQLRFAESAAQVDAAIMFVRSVCQDLRAIGQTGEPAPVEVKTLLRRNVTYAARICLQACDRLVESGDASGMFDTHPIGRLSRDLRMAGLQASLTWDEPARSYSLARWGMPPSSYLTG
jgi:alkylation response protein AidB-like acyl-CoA dehydrogenase